MTIDQMRNALVQAYSGPLWRMRVSGMEDRQVIAIYKSMEREGRLHKHNTPKKAMEQCEQLTVWNFMDEGEQNYASQNR